MKCNKFCEKRQVDSYHYYGKKNRKKGNQIYRRESKKILKKLSRQDYFEGTA